MTGRVAGEGAFVRVTLLGHSACGKTSLANAFVNNVFYAAYQPTTETQLYYTTMRISSKDDKTEHNVLMEIEDTHGSDFGLDSRGDAEIKFFYDSWAPATKQLKAQGEREREFTDSTGQPRSVRLPFSTFKAPTDVDEQGKQVYDPLTRNRMAYLILFDALDRASFQEATKLHRELKQRIDQGELHPVVYLVANKVDKDPWSSELEVLKRSARTYSEDSGVPYYEVSALQFRGVKKLFRNLMYAVLVDQKLWSPPTFPEALEDKAQQCALQ